jgi:hypothetical protein
VTAKKWSKKGKSLDYGYFLPFFEASDLPPVFLSRDFSRVSFFCLSILLKFLFLKKKGFFEKKGGPSQTKAPNVVKFLAIWLSSKEHFQKNHLPPTLGFATQFPEPLLSAPFPPKRGTFLRNPPYLRPKCAQGTKLRSFECPLCTLCGNKAVS